MTMRHPAQRALALSRSVGFTSHFAKRAGERGPEGLDATALEKRLYAALWAGDTETISFVMPSPQQPDAACYRFLLDGVSYYAIVADTGRMLTFLTQEQLRAKKFARKMQRRGGVRGVRLGRR